MMNLIELFLRVGTDNNNSFLISFNKISVHTKSKTTCVINLVQAHGYKIMFND